jgi:hypothetical protein
MNTAHTMDFDSLVEALTKKFTADVKTGDVIKYISSLGQPTHKFYHELRAKFSVSHGVMRFNTDQPTLHIIEEESDFVIEKRINSRFNALDVMARATAKGINRAMIVSGPAGLGKSFGVERAAAEINGDFTHVKGYIRPTGLYKMLYANRFKGSLIVFDDIDSLFNDETSLNLLKSACDSSDIRRISWLSNAIMEDEDGESIPSSFEFNGSIIFITNIDFQHHIDKGSKLSPHFEALMSRSHYLDLGIKSKQDYIVRIKQVLSAGMLNEELLPDEKSEIVDFIEANMNSMRELSLRMVKKLADLMIMDKASWKELAAITCMKNS